MGITISIVVGLLLLYLFCGYLTVRLTFRRKTSRKRHEAISIKINTPVSFRADREWLDSVTAEDVFIESADQLQLHALLIKNSTNSPFVICCHGYKAGSRSTAAFAHLFHSMGYSILIPEARAHGRSGGKYIGMGWPERHDILQWINYINQQFSAPPIVLFGVSMGGTTVMNTVGEALPANVKCAIEDSGYVSARDVLMYQLKKRNFPAILIYAAAPFCRVLSGFSCLRRDQTINQLKKCKIPILMLHGAKDTFVPVDHMRSAVSFVPSNATAVEFENSEHADSIIDYPTDYKNTISEFIKRLI